MVIGVWEDGRGRGQGILEPSVLRCRTLAPYVPLRATYSESVPSGDIAYIPQRTAKDKVSQLQKITTKGGCINDRRNGDSRKIYSVKAGIVF